MKEMKNALKGELIDKYLFAGTVALIAGMLFIYYCASISTTVITTIAIALVCIWYIVLIAHGVLEYKENEIKFCMLNSDAMMPEKRLEDAGYDIYACFDEPYMVIDTGETKMVPTGIASAFNDKFVAVLKERGSTGTKGIGQRSGVIDSGYRGEWMVPLTNHNEWPMVILKEDGIDDFKEYTRELIWDYEDYIIYPYEKAIAQMLLLPVPYVKVTQISKDELDGLSSERGSGKLGSSGK